MSSRVIQNRRVGLAIPWSAWIAVLGAVWLIVTPFVFGYSGNSTALINDIVVGVITLLHIAYVVIRANNATDEYRFSWFSYVPYFVIGYWLVAAPHVFGYGNDTTATWNETITGVLFLAANIYVLLYAFNHMSERA